MNETLIVPAADVLGISEDYFLKQEDAETAGPTPTTSAPVTIDVSIRTAYRIISSVISLLATREASPATISRRPRHPTTHFTLCRRLCPSFPPGNAPSSSEGAPR